MIIYEFQPSGYATTNEKQYRKYYNECKEKERKERVIIYSGDFLLDYEEWEKLEEFEIN